MTINPFQGWIIWHPDLKKRRETGVLSHSCDYGVPVYETFDAAMSDLIPALEHEFLQDKEAAYNAGIVKWLQDKGWSIECVRVHSFKV